MQNYKLLIEYDGTRYYGWQRQPDQETIQGKIEGVLSIMCDEPVEIVGAGRTDAGVHAKGMVANAHMNTAFSEDEIRDYLNRYLPDDIAVKEVRVCSDRFHARYNAVGKTYRYTWYEGPVKPVFDRRYYARLDEQPDMELMEAAARLLTGEHDFRNFCSTPRMKKSSVRNVDEIKIVRKQGYLSITYHGEGFLQNMVRILSGTILEAGMGRLSLSDIEASLDPENKGKAGPTAPAKGLCLIKVDY